MSHGMEFNWLMGGTFEVRTAEVKDARLHFGNATKFKITPTNIIVTSSRNFLE
jgi:hypothetical protein